MDKPVEIVLTALSYGGDAIGRYDGRAVFVPFGLPGETVRVRILEEHKNFARAELLEVVKTAPERITPRCRHFGECGGCHYQHLPYAGQLKVKTEILRDQLTRIGKLQDVPVKAMIASPQEWNYRNHIQFHLAESGQLGFVSSGYADAMAPIEECFLPEAAIGALWPTLDFEAGSPVERVSLRGGMNDDLLLILESPETDPPEIQIEADISVVHMLGDDAIVLAGDGFIIMNVLERSFKVSAASFFQVNTNMAARMVSHLLENLPVNAGSTVLDVYCGVGLFSAFFAAQAGRLIGIESSSSACQDFADNLDEFDHVELYEGLAQDILPALNCHADIAIIDPPRAGLDKNALDALLKLKPAVLAYVSCDPATLARDAARLVSGGYRLKQVTPFDLFPQTYHIESISIFEVA
jgi:23S rRNA (uracil1939-C5)-methyltransferase